MHVSAAIDVDADRFGRGRHMRRTHYLARRRDRRPRTAASDRRHPRVSGPPWPWRNCRDPVTRDGSRRPGTAAEFVKHTDTPAKASSPSSWSSTRTSRANGWWMPRDNGCFANTSASDEVGRNGLARVPAVTARPVRLDLLSELSMRPHSEVGRVVGAAAAPTLDGEELWQCWQGPQLPGGAAHSMASPRTSA
jgi:hypothetical protein